MMGKSKFLMIIFVIVFLYFASNSLASIIEFSSYVEKLSEPADLRLGVLTSSSYIRVFDEQQNYLLKKDLPVNEIIGGQEINKNVIPAGLRISSHLIHIDPEVDSGTTLEGWITFDQKIIAVIYATNELNNSDFLAIEGTQFYQGNLRGLEPFPQDWWWIDENDDKKFYIHSYTSNVLDEVRVITAAPTPVPLPFSGFLLGSGLAGIIIVKRRKEL